MCFAQIICQGSLDDHTSPENAASDQPEDDIHKEDHRGHLLEENVALVENGYLDGYQQTDNSVKKKQQSPSHPTEKLYSCQEDRLILC